MSELEENPADRVKVAHLVTGLVFLGVAVTWLLQASGVIGSVALGVALPLVLVAAGVLGLVAMVAGRTRRGPAHGEETDRLEPDPIQQSDSEDVR